MTEPRVMVPCEDELGESVIWHEASRQLLWIDLPRPRLHRFDPATGTHGTMALELAAPLGAIAATDDPELLVISHRKGISLLKLADGSHVPFADPEQGRDQIKYNDCKADRYGRLWAGTSHMGEREPRGALWCIDGQGSAALADAGFAVSNGPAVSPDGDTLYFNDSMGRRTFAYDIDGRDPHPRNRRIFREYAIQEGLPDGLTVDADGAVWVAMWGGARVMQLSPKGELLRTVTVPAPHVTTVCLAGDERRTAFITTARDGLDSEMLERFPLSGHLFSFEVERPGLAEPLFAIRS